MGDCGARTGFSSVLEASPITDPRCVDQQGGIDLYTDQWPVERCSNPDLDPESSTQFSIGTVYEPVANFNVGLEHRASGNIGGDWQRVSLSTPRAEAVAGQEPALDVLAIEQSLVRLEAESPMLAQVVHLHFYGGLSFPEMSALLGVNERTLFRYWRTARAQIQADLSGAG